MHREKCSNPADELTIHKDLFKHESTEVSVLRASRDFSFNVHHNDPLAVE